MIDEKRRLPPITAAHFASELEDRLKRMATEINRTRSGPTARRPPANQVAVGDSYFDTTLGRRVDSNGTAWVDGTGATV